MWQHGSKRKDDLTTSHIAFAGAQLDWEHRKIREKKEKAGAAAAAYYTVLLVIYT